MTAEPTTSPAPIRTDVAEPPPPTAAPGGGRPARRRLRWLPRYTWSGTLGAVLFGCASLTPSLLPRGWVLQGLIAGITAAIGYGVGVTVAWFVADLTESRLSPGFRHRAWQVLAVVGVLLSLVMLWLGAGWQRDIHELMGLDAPAGYTSIGIVVLALLVFALFVGIGRGIRWIGRQLVRLFGRILPRRVSRPLGVAVATALVIFLLNGVLLQGLVEAMNSAFSVKDDGTEEGAVEPTASERSGSPASLVPWADLGLQGRNFVGKGPTPEELEAFSGEPAQEPVRAYVGLASAEDVGDRAALAVRELERAGGFDRSALVIVTTTGTGWVDPAASDSLEYEFNGDTAMVAMQYSYLPSWMSFLVDQVKARDAGRALFDAVYGAWADLPADARPALYVFGESLGTFGGEAAFSGLADIENRTDGVLWAGPPNFNALTRSIVEDRDEGSPEWLPVIDDGRTVRFADEAPDLDAAARPLGDPRVVYLQNASDPIVWWSPRLIFEPPRLAARRARAGRLPEHGVAAVRLVLAGHRRHGVLDRGAGRSRALLPGRLRERVGRDRPAAGLDRRRHRAPAAHRRRGLTWWGAARVTTAAARRTRDVVVSGAVVLVLAAINVTDHLLHPPWWVRALEGAGLLAWARLDGLSWSQLGLGRDRLGSGCRWGLGAIAVVAGVYVVGVLQPSIRPAFQDVRYDLPLADALRTTFVVIPFGTVLFEEIAFRSVLWGMLVPVPAAVAGAGHDIGALRLLARHPGVACG